MITMVRYGRGARHATSRAVLTADADHASSGIAWMMTRTGRLCPASDHNPIRKRAGNGSHLSS